MNIFSWGDKQKDYASFFRSTFFPTCLFSSYHSNPSPACQDSPIHLAEYTVVSWKLVNYLFLTFNYHLPIQQ